MEVASYNVGLKEKKVPVYKCGGRPVRWRIGTGKCMYKTKAAADRAYAAYRAIKHTSSTIENMPEMWRKLFDYRIELAHEWFGYYEYAALNALPDPLAYAWIIFRKKWGRGKYTGRWIKK